MKIKELVPGKIANLVAKIIHLDEPTEAGNELSVQQGVLQDDTGQVKMTLWVDQVGKFEVGDNIIISPGFCKNFEETLQVSTGKHGKIQKVPAEKPEE